MSTCHRIVIFGYFIALIHIGVAREVDSFKLRPPQSQDSGTSLNEIFNRELDEAIAEANKQGVPDEKKLYRAILRKLGGRIISKFENLAAEELDIIPIESDQSIYRDVKTLAAPVLLFYRRLGGLCRIDDCVVGTDKFGHFLAQGYTYYKIAHLKGRGLEKALEYGANSESSYFGLHATGIFSYADLVANFQGYRFWNFLLLRHPDPLGDDKHGPFIELSHEKWRKVKHFDWSYFVDPAWDEAINKNEYRTAKIQQAVVDRIKTPLVQFEYDYSAFNDQLMAGVCARYGSYADNLLNFTFYRK